MTIGTSIICGSFCVIFPPTLSPNLPHSAPNYSLHSRGGSKVVRIFLPFMRTGDKEIRGSSHCGFYSGFYRGPHPLSNEHAPLPTSVLTVAPALPNPGLVLPR